MTQPDIPLSQSVSYKHIYIYEHFIRIKLAWCIKILTLSNIQQICSRWHSKHPVKNMETLDKWKTNYWKMLNIVVKGEITCFEQFLLLPQCFQKSSATEVSESVWMWERVKEWSGYISCESTRVFWGTHVWLPIYQ